MTEPTREIDGRYGVGDYVTRDGSDVHQVISLLSGRDGGEFLCVVAPESGWCAVGDVEGNLTRRYDPVDYVPAALKGEA